VILHGIQTPILARSFKKRRFIHKDYKAPTAVNEENLGNFGVNSSKSGGGWWVVGGGNGNYKRHGKGGTAKAERQLQKAR
jgi:hypothetical protein